MGIWINYNGCGGGQRTVNKVQDEPNEPVKWNTNTIPLMAIATIAMQSLAAVWWGATISTELKNITSRIQSIETLHKEEDSSAKNFLERFLAVETQVRINTSILQTMQRRLDYLEGQFLRQFPKTPQRSGSAFKDPE